MSSDIEGSDNDDAVLDCESIDDSPYPDEYQSEVASVASFYARFIRRYHTCPTFFLGSLQEACEAAFSSSVIEERRPVLIYIHHDKSPSGDQFCSKIFCSPEVIEYLSKNYLVWPCDITSVSNKNRFMNVWKRMFSIPLLSIYITKQCPTLIGIMRGSVEKNVWSVTSSYQFQTLLEGDCLARTQKIVSQETLLKELTTFKEECIKNENALSFNLIAKTGLCWEVVLEITEYLSLNDAITVFSPEIIPLLVKYESKFHLSNPSDNFMDMVSPIIKPEQIVSLCLKTVLSWSAIYFSILSKFTEVRFLTLVNLHREEQMSDYEKYFPKLNYLCLWYNEEADLDLLCSNVGRLQRSIKRLKIFYPSMFSSQFDNAQLTSKAAKNTTIEYLDLDTSQSRSASMQLHSCHRILSFSAISTYLIESMNRLRRIRLVTNKYNFQSFLSVYEWKGIAEECRQLNKVTLFITGGTLKDDELTQKIEEIQNKLYTVRETMKFQVIFL